MRETAERIRNVLFITALIVSGYFALFGGRYTTADLIRIQREMRSESEALAGVEAEIETLRSEIDSLRSDDVALERRAREAYGLIRDGEILLRFVPAGEEARAEQ